LLSPSTIEQDSRYTGPFAEKAWTLRQGGMWNVGNPILDTDDFTLLYVGDVLGQIQQLDSGNTDQDILFNDGIGTTLSRNISLQYETPWLNLENAQDQKNLINMRINCQTSDQRLKVDVYTNQNDTTPRYTRYLKMNVPVINRVISLAQTCRTVKFIVSSVGSPSPIKINSLQISYYNQGPQINI
jgi:hypothetical protein